MTDNLMDLNTAFSNGKWSVNVRNVGQLIDELKRLPADLPVRMGFEDSADLVVFNRDDDPHVALEDGNDWCDQGGDEFG